MMPVYKHLCNYHHGRRGTVDIEIKTINVYYPSDGNPYYKGTGMASDGKGIRFNTFRKHFYLK